MEKQMTGLVLEGGGVRGIYTAGVLDVFMENALSFDGVIGVSAGAIHACSYLSGQKGRSIRYYRRYVNDPRFMSFRSWLKTGDIIGADFCYHELPDKLDVYDHDAFLRNGTPYYAVCTDVETGKAAYIRLTDMRGQIEYLRASASLPYFSRIVELDGRKYLDGGCSDSIPVEAFRRMGYARNVVVLTRDASYRKSPEMTALAKLVYRKYPAFIRTLENRHTMYNGQVELVERLAQEGSVFVIRPSVPLEIGRLESDPEKVQQVYDQGRADALAALERLQAWMKH
ncbi:MAG: patatin family protein [Clostridiales bacterium]|nr:patatin family protein [Clostridiales bacterium]